MSRSGGAAAVGRVVRLASDRPRPSGLPALADLEVLVVEGLAASTREQALAALAELLAEQRLVRDARVVAAMLLERERLAPTVVARGAALPHGRSEMVTRPMAVVATLGHPVAFSPPAADAVERVFVVLAPHGAEEIYLRALASVAQLARDPSRSKAFCASILGR